MQLFLFYPIAATLLLLFILIVPKFNCIPFYSYFSFFYSFFFFSLFLTVDKLNLKNGKDKEKETKIDSKIQGGNTKGKGVDPYKDIDQRFMESKNVLHDTESSDLYALLTEGSSSSKNLINSDDQQQSEYSFNSRNILLGFDDRPKKNPKIPESKKNLKYVCHVCVCVCVCMYVCVYVCMYVCV